MNKLVIQEVPAYDGTYEFENFDNFTNRELHRIKRMTGLRVGEFDEALSVGDNDLLVALAVVVLERNGKTVVDDAMWDAPVGAFTFDFTGAEEEEDPTQDGAPNPVSASDEKPNASPKPSGETSTESSDLLANGQSHIGALV